MTETVVPAGIAPDLLSSTIARQAQRLKLPASLFRGTIL